MDTLESYNPDGLDEELMMTCIGEIGDTYK